MARCKRCGAKAGFMNSICAPCAQAVWAANRMNTIAQATDVDGLIALLDDQEWQVRETAATALGNLRDRRALEPLGRVLVQEFQRPFMNSFEPNRVTKAAASALVKIGDPVAADLLAGALRDNFGQCNVNVALALAEFYDERAVEALMDAFTSYIGETRARVVEALGRLGDDRAIEVLRRGLNDENNDVRMRAEEALRDLGVVPAAPTTTATSTDLRFHPDCPMCRASLGETSRPRGILTSGTTTCSSCKSQISLRVSPNDNRLYVRMLTIPANFVDPGETAWDSISEVANNQPVRAERPPTSEMHEAAPITKGIRLEGERHQVSTANSKVGRAAKCCDCAKVISLVNAREVCLDWDGVDAYHFYCPTCYTGTEGENYYTGRLIGADGSQVIDQHSWYYE